MNKLIILEGPDNMGKTTLAKEIIGSVNNGVYLHGIKVGDTKAQKRYHHNLLDIAVANLDLKSDCVIIDRHWISHLVYNRYPGFCEKYYHTTDNSEEYSKEFIERLKLLKAVYVFCYSEKGEEEYSKNIDPDHPYTVKEYKEYCKVYRDFYLSFSNNNPRVFQYDFTQHGKNNENLNHFINLILEYK